MNIFLLFISMVLMIGYYIMSSPSQNVAGQNTDTAIEVADLRSKAECVSDAHNKAMFCETYEDPCVMKYGVESKIYKVTPTWQIDAEYSCGGTVNSGQTLVVVTVARDVVPSSKYNEMMDVLEKYYSEAGTFGLFADTGLKIPGVNELYEIKPTTITGHNQMDLKDGMLVYYFASSTQDSPITPPNPDEPLVCPAGYHVETNWLGVQNCIADSLYCLSDQYNPFTHECCEVGQVYDEESHKCIDGWDVCHCEGDYTGVYIPDTNDCICVPSYAPDFCSNGVPQYDFDTGGWICLQSAELAEAVASCGTGGFHVSNHGVSPTMMHISPCNSCEITQITRNGTDCVVHCIPDGTKYNTRSCYSDTVDADTCKTRTDAGIYFGFSKGSNVEGLKDANGNDVVIDFTTYPFENRLKDRKFHCLKCVNRIDSGDTVFPYVVNCVGGEVSMATSSGGTSTVNDGKGNVVEDDGKGGTTTPEKTDEKPVVLKPTTDTGIGGFVGRRIKDRP